MSSLSSSYQELAQLCFWGMRLRCTSPSMWCGIALGSIPSNDYQLALRTGCLRDGLGNHSNSWLIPWKDLQFWDCYSAWRSRVDQILHCNLASTPTSAQDWVPQEDRIQSKCWLCFWWASSSCTRPGTLCYSLSDAVPSASYTDVSRSHTHCTDTMNCCD